ncbi:unnamed protein product [Spirodela intermedia]|uniref:Uncharacterized protein n=1 Tax=Spirodela intermedia TaxID=51605 RepID=A0A7I8IPF2_SPIIN|nr:unnamed protein product [Spirodela intermedia]CAA6659749.1 unnamed protein product [Spirodela intermedia]
MCTPKRAPRVEKLSIREPQRRLNPNMMKIVKKKIFKCLATDIIYPISDSKWEKSHFMVREGVVLGHIVSERGLEVDRAKIDIISKMKPPNLKNS